MAKAPLAGQVKTRLCPPLSLGQAVVLYRAFLFDKIAQVRTLAAARPAIAYTPASGEDFFADLAPDFTLIVQQGAELGERLINCVDYFLQKTWNHSRPGNAFGSVREQSVLAS